MNWDGTRTGFFNELAKIAEFSLRGLSPETVMEKSQPPPPMETPGFDKARNILARASQTKTAASRHVQRVLPLQPGIGKLTHQGDESSPEQAKSVAGYGLAGLGTGGALHKAYSSMPKVYESMNRPMSDAAKFTAGARNNAIGNKLMLGGAAVGAGYGAYRAHKKSQRAQMDKKGTMTKLSTLLSPAIALKASKQVGKLKVTPSAHGSNITTQIRGQLIGRKGTP